MENRIDLKKEWIVGIGEALWDVLPEGRKIGGAPANFAYNISQFGLNGCAVSAIGDDEPGRELCRQLHAKGVVHMLEVVPYPTGSVEVEVDPEGIPTYDIRQRVAWDNLPFTESLQQLARHTRAVCFGSLAQRNPTTHTTIAQFLDSIPDDGKHYKIFDINLRQQFYSTALIEQSLTRCNILKLNDEELIVVSRLFGIEHLPPEEQCRTLFERYDLQILILTCGAIGSFVFTSDEMSYISTPHVKVADTVGAGDSFTASFLAALLAGKDIGKAHRLAVDVSAYVCTQPGAMPKLPESLLEQGRRPKQDAPLEIEIE